MYEQQAFYNSGPIDFNKLDLWDKFKVTFGFNVTEKTKPMVKNFNFEYCGFSTFIMPVDGVGGILAKWFSNKHNVSVPTPYTSVRTPFLASIFIVIQKQNLLWLTAGIVFPVQWQNIMQKLDNLFI